MKEAFSQGYSNEERLTFRSGILLFPSRLTRAVSAFTNTFSPDVFGVVTTTGLCEILCRYI